MEDFEKIKRNVAKMVSMNAPETDIDAYLKTERLTPQEFSLVAKGGAKLGDIRMTQQSQGGIARAQSVGQTIPAEGLERAGLLPFSKETATGDVSFDSDAGILGILKRSVMAPGDVMAGKLDPNSPEGARRTAEMAGTVTPLSAASRAANVVPGTLKTLRLGEPKVPTAQQLKTAGSEGFEAARNLGVDYSPDAVKSMVDDLTRSLQEKGINDITAPTTSALLARAGTAPEAEDGAAVFPTLNNLMSLREALGTAAGSGNATERKAASRAIDALDEFIAQADPQSVMAGAASAAGRTLEDARGNYAAAMRSDTVTKAVTKAERNAAKSNSGQNLDNATRQRLESILDKGARGFSPEERQLLDDIVRGKHGANIARYVGNLLGGGGGLGQFVTGALGATAGAAVGGTPGAIVGAAAPAAIGTTLKQVGANITRKQASKLDELLRKRSPLYKKAQENPPVLEGVHPEIRALISRALLLQQMGQEGSQP